MTKLKNKTDNKQLSLFDIIKEHHKEQSKKEPQNGTLNIALQLQEIISKCIGTCPQGRDVIAGKMSELTGQIVTRFQIDSWTASAKHGHRFPAEYLPAFCVAIQNHRPIEFIARKAGIFTMPDEDVLRAELVREIEKKEEVNKKIRKIKTYLQGMEVK